MEKRLTANECKFLEDADKKFIWHPFTQMQDYRKEVPLVISRGEGNYLIDIYGNKYIDGVSSLWVNIHGHVHPHINQAIKDQVDRISHSTLLGISNVPAILLAKRLVEITPKSLTKVFYSESGSTAVEIALKMAFQYWQQKKSPGLKKTKFISLTEAYHGDTIGAVSVGGIDLFHKVYKPLLFGNYKIPTPYCYRCVFDKTYPECELYCLSPLEKILKEKNEEIIGLIIEPLVQGAAGMLMSPPGYLKKARELCKAYGVLFIADEVAVGFGRTGKMFACEHEGVVPDIMTVAKGLTGGYLPLAATIATDEIYEAFLGEYSEFKTFFHGHTYTGNPVCCAAALSNLEIFEKEKTLDGLKEKIQLLKNGLKNYNNLSHVGDIRQKGFMVGIELVKDKKTKEQYPIDKKMGIKVIMEARTRKVVIRPLGNVIILMPPLSILPSQLKMLLKVVYDSIKVVT
jgi:adenosylmethionine-8-amino-7-oxononanoate aminotransferase